MVATRVVVFIFEVDVSRYHCSAFPDLVAQFGRKFGEQRKFGIR
jgi:hypothetical protein